MGDDLGEQLSGDPGRRGQDPLRIVHYGYYDNACQLWEGPLAIGAANQQLIARGFITSFLPRNVADDQRQQEHLNDERRIETLEDLDLRATSDPDWTAEVCPRWGPKRAALLDTDPDRPGQ